MFKVYYKMPLCYLSLHSDGKFLTRVDFCDNKRSEKNCSLLDLAKYELDLYFTHKLRKFSIPVLIQGTDFESKVYKALMKIPYGNGIGGYNGGLEIKRFLLENEGVNLK